MSESIIDGAGSGYYARVSPEGRLLVDISGATINIGSVSAHVDSIYVQSGVTFVDSRSPIENSWNPNIQLVYAGTSLSRVIKSTPIGSVVQNFSWSGGLLVNVGSWI